MNSEINEFVRAGLRHYAEAVQTTSRFVSELQNLLVEALDDEADRSVWQRKEGSEIGKGSGAGSKPWVCASQQVVVAGFPDAEAKLVVGVWWRQEGPVIYTHFSGGPDHCRKFSRVEGRDVKWLKEGGTQYFLCAPRDPADIRADVTALLDHLEKVVSSSAPTEPT